MARRSRAREVALQMLFQKDQNEVSVPRPAIERFAQDRLRDPELVAFALALYDGVLRHQAEIDQALAATAENWRLHRMMPADRNVLRLGAYELLHDSEPSPAAAVLNEAIELARRYGTADSPGFVNGILDKIARTRGQESVVRIQETGTDGQYA
ncbi:MAG TPA: transcription antitermination factor NusB, partial [Fimbriiglobus sp.]|nr:transcription antitermination factor NusB [Fimbriiglobus sp.]